MYNAFIKSVYTFLAILAGVLSTSSTHAAKQDVIWLEGRIVTVADAPQAEVDAVERTGRTAIPFIVKLNHLRVLHGDFSGTDATVELPIATLLAQYRNIWVYVLLRKSTDGKLHTLDWDYLDRPTCFSRAFAQDNGLEDLTLQLRHTGKLVWSATCDW